MFPRSITSMLMHDVKVRGVGDNRQTFLQKMQKLQSLEMNFSGLRLTNALTVACLSQLRHSACLRGHNRWNRCSISYKDHLSCRLAFMASRRFLGFLLLRVPSANLKPFCTTVKEFACRTRSCEVACLLKLEIISMLWWRGSCPPSVKIPFTTISWYM